MPRVAPTAMREVLRFLRALPARGGGARTCIKNCIEMESVWIGWCSLLWCLGHRSPKCNVSVTFKLLASALHPPPLTLTQRGQGDGHAARGPGPFARLLGRAAVRSPPRRGRWLYGLSGMPPQFAREADDNLVFLAALYVLTALVSAAGVWMAWRRRVRLVRVGVAYATKGFMRFTNALLVYYVLQLFVNLIALITFFSIRCGFHNVGASPGNVAARTLYQTSTMFGGVFTNAVLELVLLRKAQMMEGFAARGTGCNRCIAWLIWVQIILLLLGLPFGVISNVNLVSKGPEKAFDYDDSGSVEASEDPTVPFQATMALFGLVHVAASITLCVIFVQLLQLAQRRNRVLASEGSAPGPRVIRADTSTQAPCTVTHRHLLSPI